MRRRRFTSSGESLSPSWSRYVDFSSSKLLCVESCPWATFVSSMVSGVSLTMLSGASPVRSWQAGITAVEKYEQVRDQATARFVLSACCNCSDPMNAGQRLMLAKGETVSSQDAGKALAGFRHVGAMRLSCYPVT